MLGVVWGYLGSLPVLEIHMIQVHETSHAVIRVPGSVLTTLDVVWYLRQSIVISAMDCALSFFD